ncbi:aldehyde dehydrogenase [Lachnospiraceae bacterium 54-53]
MYQELIKKQRQFFYTDQTKSYEFRINQLEKLEKAIRQYESALYDAFDKDLRKSRFEVYSTEIGFVLSSIRGVKKRLKGWMKPKRVGNPLFLAGSKSYIINEPYGVMLIIGPYNYPFQLTMEPLVGAIAAGNTAVIKPSELTPHVSGVIREMIEKTFGEEYVCVVEGEVEETTRLLEQRFDYIFFTGSPRVGKIVMEAAAENLTPVTLELGGKSPAIVTGDANAAEAAVKIVWGKFLNTGQTCVAPDYVLADERIKSLLLAEMKKAVRSFYGEDPLQSRDYGRMATVSHWKRVDRLLKASAGHVVIGGESEESEKYISPTILDDVAWEDRMMQEEIFGPVLPVISYAARDFEKDVIDAVRNREKPLALYLFTRDPEIRKRVIKSLSFGGGVINDTILHLSNTNLPFGGVGNSGIGSYHGIHGFQAFSHRKSVIEKSELIKLNMLYPPYTVKNMNLLKKILR